MADTQEETHTPGYVWLLYFISAVVFVLSCSLDFENARKRKARWIPGRALAVNALTIQLLSFIDGSNIDYTKKQELRVLVKFQLLIDSGRLMICVFIAYVLPGMATSSFKSAWDDIGTLAFSLSFHMVNEIYLVSKLQKMKDQSNWDKGFTKDESNWYIGFTSTLCIAVIFLLLLLSCAVIAGKSIRNITSRTIPSALSCCSKSPNKRNCGKVKNHVLKCWIVVRACQPDYIIARSVFSSFASLVVTICVIIFVVKGAWIEQTEIGLNQVSRAMKIVFQFLFILIAWIVIVYRSFTAVMYFPRSFRSLFPLEDFWTRTIVDFRDELYLELRDPFFLEKRNRERTTVQNLIVKVITTIRIHCLLLTMGLWLQKLMVSLSKFCWFLTEIFLIMFRPCVMSRPERNIPDTDEHYLYKKALETVRMPGESAYGLWKTSEQAFKETEIQIITEVEKSKVGLEKLINFIAQRTKSSQDEVVQGETVTQLQIEKNLKYIGKMSWKMRAISLIKCMIYNYDPIHASGSDVQDAMEACSQAWDFMDFVDRSDRAWDFIEFVDSSDREANLVSEAADEEFKNLQKIWNKLRRCTESESKNTQLDLMFKIPLRKEIDQLEKLEKETENKSKENAMWDSHDWKRLAAQVSFYKTHTANYTDLRCLLASLIGDCLQTELEEALIEKCNIWAINCSKWKGYEDLMEQEVFNAAFIAGKAEELLHQIRQRDRM